MPAGHLAFLHTAESNVDAFGALMAEMAPDVPVRHVVAADLLAEAMREGCIGPALAAKVHRAMRDAGRAGATVVLCTCSTLGACAEAADDADGPAVLRVDRPMAEAAIAQGTRILVAACAETTVGPTMALLDAVAPEMGKAIEIRTLLMGSAWAKFMAGDRDAYLAEIAAGLRSARRDADIVVLAQASMAGAGPLCADLGVPVLSSPRLGVAAAVKAFRERRRRDG